MIDVDDQLSTHFSLAELIASDTGERLGIDNTPSDTIRLNLAYLARQLERVRELLDAPLHINSGYRCDRLNSAIGGSGKSRHMLGLAADFTAAAYGPPIEICRAIEAHLAEFEIDQLIYEYTWVHMGLAIPGETPRQQVLTLMPGKTYAKGIIARAAA